VLDRIGSPDMSGLRVYQALKLLCECIVWLETPNLRFSHFSSNNIYNSRVDSESGEIWCPAL
jgi:hypothetical protein